MDKRDKGSMFRRLRERLFLGLLLLAFFYGLFWWAGQDVPHADVLSLSSEWPPIGGVLPSLDEGQATPNPAQDMQTTPNSQNPLGTQTAPDLQSSQNTQAAPNSQNALGTQAAPNPQTPQPTSNPHASPSSTHTPAVAADGSPMDLIGVNDIVFQPETDAVNVESSLQKEAITIADREKLYDFDYLRNTFYLMDADTGLLPSDIDMDYFLDGDMTIDNTLAGPKVLVFHTHSNEMYADSHPDDPFTGIMGAGALLAQLLTEKYGIETLHHTGRYDIVNGKSQIPGAYERMEPPVQQILQDNPSIQLVIDLHRDGLKEGIPPMVTEIGGERVARIMFINGLCRLRSNGVLNPVSGLENPYLLDNMALSFRLQLTANAYYPNFTRKLYLKAYRYSLNMLPKSLLVEIGAQNNTQQEALNAMAPLAEMIARVTLP